MISKLVSHLKDRKIKKAQRREMERNANSSFDEVAISWMAPEFVKYQRGLLWKFIVTFIATGLIVFGYLYNAWTFSLAVIVFIAAYAIINRKDPREIKVTISEIGIKAGYRKYPYSLIKDFCVVYKPPYTSELHIRVSNDLAHDVMIQLWGQNPSEVRNYLLTRISEKHDHKELLSDALLKLFKL